MKLIHPILIICAMILAGCAAPSDTDTSSDPGTPGGSGTPDDTIGAEEVSGGSGSGGGAVQNAAPTIPTFTASNTAGDNSGNFQVVFTANVRDGNGQNDIAGLSLASTGAGTITLTHTVTAADRSAANEPAGWTAGGWKVWGGEARDGILHAKVRHTFVAFGPSGNYDFRFTGTDAQGASGSSNTIRVTIASFSLVEVDPTPVHANGTADTGSNWGAWTAAPGATNVEARNYVKVVNSGDVSDTSVVVDFTPALFSGLTDAGETIPIDGNIAFAWWEDTTPGTTAPEEGTYVFGGSSAQGSVTVTFSGQGNIIYVVYRVAALPDILSQQEYGAAFTVTEL